MGEVLRGNGEDVSEGDYLEIFQKKTVKDIDGKDIELVEGNSICIEKIDGNKLEVCIQTGGIEEQIFGNGGNIKRFTLSKATYMTLKHPHTYHMSKISLVGAKIKRKLGELIK